MKSAEIRQILESEILRLKAYKKPLKQHEFDKYCKCLKKLCALEQRHAMKQGRIYTCTYGSMGEFVREFIKYISPLMHRMKKEIHFSNVLVPRTRILFSPRLTEIALGSILSEFFRIGNIVNISLFSTKSGVAVCVSGKKLQNSKRVLQCIGHIARLHGGRCIVSFCATERKIILTFPVFPNFHPLKLVPCSTELCRLCHI